MPLSDDQRAMLKLVSQPDTSHEDIAALMGLSVEEVRAKIDDALRQLDSAPEPAGAAPEPDPPKPDPTPPAPEPAPPAPEPTKAAEPKPPAKATGLRLPDDKGARNALYAGAAVVVVLVVLLVTGVLGGGDGGDGEPGSAATTATGAETPGSNQGKVPTEATLEEVDGSGAEGRAVFGRAGKQVVLLVQVKNLDPAPKGQAYTVSIGKSSQERVPLIASSPNEKGEIVGSFRIAPQILGLLASGYDRMEVSLVPNGELGSALKAAQKSGSAPSYGGTEIAAGDVTGPIVEAAEGG